MIFLRGCFVHVLDIVQHGEMGKMWPELPSFFCAGLGNEHEAPDLFRIVTG